MYECMYCFFPIIFSQRIYNFCLNFIGLFNLLLPSISFLLNIFSSLDRSNNLVTLAQIHFPFGLRHAQSFFRCSFFCNFFVDRNPSIHFQLQLLHFGYSNTYALQISFFVPLQMLIKTVAFGSSLYMFYSNRYTHFSFQMSLIESKSVVCYSKHVFVCTASFVKCSSYTLA